MSPRGIVTAVAITAYLGSVVLANWLTTNYGFIPVGFGLTATAGTLAIGGALVVRDVLQDAIGRLGVALLILVGAVLSFAVSNPLIALASMLAFAISEALDMLVYTPLRRRGDFGGFWWQAAVAAGAVVGAIADTIVFLWVAFGAAAIRPALPGQLLGKLEVAAALILIGAAAGALLRQSKHAQSA